MADWGERESPRWRGVARGAVDVSSDANELLQGPARDFDFPALLAIADSLPLMIAYCDLDLTYRFVNRPMARWFGVSRKSMLGRRIDHVMGSDQYEARRPALERALGGEVQQLSAEYVHPDHGLAYTKATYQPHRDADGRMLGLVIIVENVTETRLVERDLMDQLRQAQKMEALGQLTGGIAHDFNNLLTVVVGGLDMINRRVEDDRTRAYATNALAAAERGARLTGQLLAFSRVQKLEVKPSDVTAILEDTRKLLRNVLGPGIEKRFDFGGDRAIALADPTQLEVALLNLAVNARDAMPDGGCLCFSLQSVTIDDDPELAPGDYVALSVKDTGSGMPDEVVDRVFEPFFTTKEVGKGTGLGLSMVYGMARQSGGTARITSKEGEGTTVTLYLRAADRDAQAVDTEEPHDIAPRPCDDRSVLVVDDDEAVRAFMAETLRDGGFEVREAGNGREALALFEDRQPDLVVLDYIMPGMSGAEVARTMLERRADQPILFVSGYSETEAIRAAAPEARLLAKPFRGEALMDALGDLVRTD